MWFLSNMKIWIFAQLLETSSVSIKFNCEIHEIHQKWNFTFIAFDYHLQQIWNKTQYFLNKIFQNWWIFCLNIWIVMPLKRLMCTTTCAKLLAKHVARNEKRPVQIISWKNGISIKNRRLVSHSIRTICFVPRCFCTILLGVSRKYRGIWLKKTPSKCFIVLDFFSIRNRNVQLGLILIHTCFSVRELSFFFSWDWSIPNLTF